MLIYFVFFALQLLPVAIARAVGLNNDKHVIAVCALLAAAFAGLRGNVGVDTVAYRNFYEDPAGALGDNSFEPLFLLIATIGNAIGAGSQFLIMLVAVAQAYLMYRIARVAKESDLLYLVLVSQFYVYLNLNLIRLGLALYLVVFAILWVRQLRRPVQAQAWFLVGVVTHLSVSIMAPALWRNWYRALPFALAFVLLTIDTLNRKLFDYFLEGNLFVTEFSLGFGFVALTALLGFVLVREGLARQGGLVTLFLLSTALKVGSYYIPILDRIAIIFSLAFFALLVVGLKRPLSKLAIVIIVLYGTYGSLAFVANSDEAIDDLIAAFPGMASLYADPRWLPYRFFWEQ